MKQQSGKVVLLHNQPAHSAQLAAPERLVNDVFEKHHGALRGLFRRFVTSDHEIEDLMQDVYERLCKQTLRQGWDNFPKSYVLKTATSVFRDKLRKQRTRMADQHDDIETHELVSSEGSPEQSLEHQEALKVIKRAIIDLPESRRRIFLMHRIHHKTLKEISVELDIPLRSVERYLGQALVHCRNRLEREIGMSNV